MNPRKPKVILAQTAGFCTGVRRAIKMVLEAANDPTTPAPIRTVGPLIHNEQVLELLQSKGVSAAADEDTVREGTAVIRAHGVSPQKKQELSKTCQKTIDATCPHVRKVQRITERHARAGYHCVVVGDRGHAEVAALLSRAAGKGHVVAGPQDVDRLPEMQKVVVVAQTTQNTETFDRTVGKLRARWPDCKVFDTICRATELRQAEVARLAQQVDAMVVVGGYHSANTRRLAEISAAAGTPTKHVETDDDLDPQWISQHQTVGVTAGASTPNWMIGKVLRKVRRAQQGGRRSASEILRRALAGPIHTNIFLGGGAVALTYANTLLMGIAGPSLWACCALAFLFLLSQHLLNQYVKRDALYLDDPDKADFFRLNERPLLFLCVSSMVGALALAFFLGWVVFTFILLGSVAGVLYRPGLGRKLGRRVGIQSLEQLPGSKDIFVGLAWAVATALIPALALSHPFIEWKALSVAFLFSFVLAGQRALMTGLRDAESDQLIGRETIAVALGENRSGKLFMTSLLVEVVLLGVLGGALGWTTRFCYVLLLLIPYAALYGLLFCWRKLPEGEMGEAVIDAEFYFLAVLALLWRLL